MKAKKIAVFDSIEGDCAVTMEAVKEHFDRRSIAVKVNGFTECESFVCDFRDNRYDMTFIGLNGVLDLETARSIWGLDRQCPMFFVSRVGDYGIEGYRLNVLDYLIKPVTQERVREAVSRIGCSI